MKTPKVTDIVIWKNVEELVVMSQFPESQVSSLDSSGTKGRTCPFNGLRSSVGMARVVWRWLPRWPPVYETSMELCILDVLIVG